MADQVAWERKWLKGLTNAGYEGKNILLYFSSAKSVACRQMEAVTFADDKVAAFLNEHLVPIQIQADEAGDLGERYELRWTPHLLVLNPRERVLQMATGWFSPEELVPWTIMGLARDHFLQKNWTMTKVRCQWIIDDYPNSFAAPQAIYYHGVAATQADHDTRHLKAVLTTLQKNHPHSEWTMRARPFAKL